MGSLQVATNDPTYDQQLENWKGYWRPISEVFMPGETCKTRCPQGLLSAGP